MRRGWCGWDPQHYGGAVMVRLDLAPCGGVHEVPRGCGRHEHQHPDPDQKADYMTGHTSTRAMARFLC